MITTELTTIDFSTTDLAATDLTAPDLSMTGTSTGDVPTVASIRLLTERVASAGIDADRLQLLMLAHRAQDLGVSGVLIDVMVDEAAPAVARLRAYGRVASRACALDGARPQSKPMSHVA